MLPDKKSWARSARGFWDKLDRPIVCMAPMADVTDAPFRQMFARYGKPDVTWTEFVSADGLFLRPIPASPRLCRTGEPGAGKLTFKEMQEIALSHGVDPDHPLLKDLIYTEGERPIVAQFFSKDPERMFRAARLARALGFDGVDINMGCPAAIICRQGAGSAMIKTPELAQEIIQATVAGAGDLPVSVKTRIGYNQDELDSWLPALLAANPVAVILHARTRKQMSKVPADWSAITRAVTIRNELAPEILILGNGDVDSRAEALERVAETGADGVMVGRGIFGNPWFFNPQVDKGDLGPEEILPVLLEHTRLYEDILGNTKSFALMKKHYKAYVNGFDGAKELRVELMEAENYAEVERVVSGFCRASRDV